VIFEFANRSRLRLRVKDTFKVRVQDMPNRRTREILPVKARRAKKH